jgi:hypothetical protein
VSDVRHLERALPLKLADLDAERGEAANRALTENVRAAAARERLLMLEGEGDGDAEPSGEVVVAGARASQQLSAGGLSQRADLRLRGHDGKRLHGAGDGRVGEIVVAPAAAPARNKEAAGDQPGQVLAGRRWGIPARAASSLAGSGPSSMTASTSAARVGSASRTAAAAMLASPLIAPLRGE